MKILDIKIHNILSIEDAYFKFDDNGLVLVEGWDHDNMRSNGAGKSSIFNAMSFGLYDKLPRKVTKTEVLRRGTKDGYVELNILCGEDTYTITRCRPSGVTFKKNDTDIQMTQEEFEDKLKMSFEQFIITMYTAQGSNDKFIFLGDKDKKDFILNLMKLDGFNSYHKIAKDMASNVEKDISSIEAKINIDLSKIEVYKTQFVDIKTLQDTIDYNNSEIDKFNKEIIEYQKVRKPDMSKYSDLEEKVQQSLTRFSILESERRTKFAEYNKISTELNKVFVFNKPVIDSICPGCNLPLSVHGKRVFKVEDTTAQELEARSVYDLNKENLALKMNDLNNTITSIDKELLKKKDIVDVKSKLEAKKNEEFNDYDSASAAITERHRVIAARQSNNKNLEEKIQSSDKISTNISSLEENIVSNNLKIAELKKTLEIYDTLAGVFSPMGAPAYVVDSAVDAFNNSVSKYVSMIWPNVSYQLQSFKVNKDSKVTAKFSESLIINGKPCSIGSLSGGELRSLSLALDFAILDVMSTNFSINLNPIILDEPFDGLDSTGREAVIDLLSKISVDRSIIVVDHMSECKSLFSKIIKVEKRNGISSIV